MRTRITASALALALAVVGFAPVAATAKPVKITTCDKLAAAEERTDGFDKIDGSSGTLAGDWGSVSWSSNDVDRLEVEDGANIWLCVKTGGNGGTNVFGHEVASPDDIPQSLQDLRHGISHVAVVVGDLPEDGDDGGDGDDGDDGDGGGDEPIIIF